MTREAERGYTRSMSKVPFEWSRPVEFHETDMAGIVHFSCFFRWMEAAEHAFLRDRGVDLHVEKEGKVLGWPRVHCGCDFRKPLRYGDDIVVRVEVEEVRTRSVRYRFEIGSSTFPELAAEGKITAACVSLEGKEIKAVEIPAEIRARLER